MRNGEIILYKENNHYKAGSFIEEKNGRFYLIGEDNKTLHIAKDKVVTTFGTGYKSIGEFLNKASDIKIELKNMYETLNGIATEFTIEDIASLYFNMEIIPELHYSLIKAVSNDEIYFTIRNERIVLHSSNAVEAKIEELRKISEALNQKKMERENAFCILKDILVNNKIVESVPVEMARLLQPLKEFCIQGDEYSKKNESINLLNEIVEKTGYKALKDSYRECFNILAKTGILKNDDEIFVKRYGIKTNYSESDLDLDVILGNRSDYTDHYSFTIDDAETKDIDDGLSCRITDTGYEFFIHIADPDEVIQKNSLFDKDAFSRGTSVYLVTAKYPMFPREVSYGALSLIKGTNRYALSCCFTTDKDYNIKSAAISMSVVNIKERLTYDDADRILDNAEESLHESLSLFHNFAVKLRDKRITNGALMLDQPDLKLFVGENGKVSYEVTDSQTNSHEVVREMMILFNKNIAEFGIINKLPLIYISQDSPESEQLKYSGKTQYTKKELLAIFPVLKKSVIGTTPGPHFCMGLSYYTQATSPIRRYIDLSVHRIVKNHLSGNKITVSSDDIKVIAATVTARNANAVQAERESIKYWTLRYIEQNITDEYKGIVIKRIPGGTLCEIEALNLRVNVTGNEKVEQGDRVIIKFKDISPYTGYVNGSYSLVTD